MRNNIDFNTELEFVFKRNKSTNPEKKPKVPLFKIKANKDGTLTYYYDCCCYLDPLDNIHTESGYATIDVKKDSFTTISHVLERLPNSAGKYPTTYYVINITIDKFSFVKIHEMRFCIDKKNNMNKIPELYRLHKIHDPNITSIESLCENSKLVGFYERDKIKENEKYENPSWIKIFKLPSLVTAAKAFKDCKNLVGELPYCDNLFGSDETLQPLFPDISDMYNGDSLLTGDLLKYIPLGNILEFTSQSPTKKIHFSGIFKKCGQLFGNLARIMGYLAPIDFPVTELNDCKKITPVCVNDLKRFKEGLYVFQVRVTEQNKKDFKLVGFTMDKSVTMMMSIVGNKDTSYYTDEKSFIYTSASIITYSFPFAGEYIIDLYWCVERIFAPIVSNIYFGLFNLNVTRLYVIEDEDIKSLDYLLNKRLMLDFNNEKDEKDFNFLPPALLILKMPSLNSMKNMYYGTGITSIPKNLFEKSTVNGVISIEGLFSNCKSLTDTPPMLFSKFIKATKGDRLFDHCEKLEKIDADIFRDTNFTSMCGTFQGCSSITTLPSKLFSKTKGKDFTETFKNCISLETIEDNIFDSLTAITSLDSTFNGCEKLRRMPPCLFYGNKSVTNMSHTFDGCEKLENVAFNFFNYFLEVADFSTTFKGCTKLSNLSTDKIAYKKTDENKKAKDFSFIFQGCTELKTIPSDLFYACVKADTFESAFEGCSILTEISGDLFKNNKEVKNFNATFKYCDSITEIPTSLFANNPKVESFNSTFEARPTYKDTPNQPIQLLGKINPAVFASNPAMTTFINTFKNQTRIQEIPAGLFDKNTLAKNFDGTFWGCENIKKIPNKLFDKNIRVESFDGTFGGCKKIEEIPDNFFDKNTLVKIFDGTFWGCENITKIPNKLFDKNTQVNNFKWAFGNCKKITKIPDKLFDKNILVESFKGTFGGCEKITKIPDNFFDENTLVNSFYGTFSGCENITKIPNHLFDKNILVESFYGTFWGCKKIEEIPDNFFSNNFFDKNTQVESFDGTFLGCENIKKIPNHLFDKNILVNSFEGTFGNCKKITKIPDNLFDKNILVESFKGTFLGCKKITKIPANLFDKNTKVTSFKGTFLDCEKITKIPDNLFDENSNVISFESTFENCSNVKEISACLFKMNFDVESFEKTFCGCNKLTNIVGTGSSGDMDKLFGSNLSAYNFNSTFENCSFDFKGTTSTPAKERYLMTEVISFKNLFQHLQDDIKDKFSMQRMFYGIVCNTYCCILLSELGILIEQRKEKLVYEYLYYKGKLDNMLVSRRQSIDSLDTALILAYPALTKDPIPPNSEEKEKI